MRILTTVALGVLAVLGSAAAASPPPALLPGIGENAQLHVTRTQQTLDAPDTSAYDVLVRRRSATTVVLERTAAGGGVDDSVFSLNADGTLALVPSEAARTRDPDLQALMQGVNLALKVMHGAVAPPAGWDATLSLPSGRRGATATVIVPLRALNVAGNDLDLRGSGQSESQGREQPESAPRRSRPSGGGFPGGGFPGGGFPAASGGARGGGSSQITVFVRVDGHVSDGRVRRLTIAQTRAVDVEGTTFTNVSSWEIAVVK